MDDVIQYPCPLDESVQVVEVPFGPDAGTLAMIVMAEGKGVILLDSNLPEEFSSQDHKMAIFAHELGHLACGEDEVAAETWALKALQERGLGDAAQLLVDRGIINDH